MIYRRIPPCLTPARSHNMKIDVIAALSVFFLSPLGDPTSDPSFALSLVPFPSCPSTVCWLAFRQLKCCLFHTPPLSVLFGSPLLSFTTSLPPFPCSHKGPICFHWRVERQQPRSHGAILRMMGRCYPPSQSSVGLLEMSIINSNYPIVIMMKTILYVAWGLTSDFDKCTRRDGSAFM